MAKFGFDSEKLVTLCRQSDASMVAVFGSRARGDAGPLSDIDVMIRFAKPKSLLSLIRLERELSAALGTKVDLVTEQAISPYLIDRIRQDLTVLYEA
jgi:hypothetical protein